MKTIKITNRFMRYASLAFLVCLGTTTVTTSRAAGAEALITLVAHDPSSGEKIGGASVVVRTKYSGSVAARGTTDSNGEATFQLGERHVSASYYTATVSASGYESSSMSLSVMGADMSYTVPLKRAAAQTESRYGERRGFTRPVARDFGGDCVTCPDCSGSGVTYEIAGRKRSDGSYPVREIPCSKCRGHGKVHQSLTEQETETESGTLEIVEVPNRN